MANPRSKDPAKNQAPKNFSADAASPARPDPAKPANEIKPSAATRAVSPVPPKLEPAKPAAEIDPAAGINPLADALRSAVVKHRIEAAPAAGAMPVAEIKPAATPAPVVAKPVVEIKPAAAPIEAKSAVPPVPPKPEPIKTATPAATPSPAPRPAPVAVEIRPTPPKTEKSVVAPAVLPPAAVRQESGPVPTKAPPALMKPEPAVSEQAVVKEIPKLKKTEPEAEEPALEAAPPPRPTIPSMFVVMIASELTPVAKVGGLADVVYGLARELEARGNAVEIILPKYDCMRYDHIYGLTKAYENLWVPWYGGGINTTVYFGFVHGRKCYFI